MFIKRTKISTEGGKLDDVSESFFVSSPSRSRLRAYANTAAQEHLAVLVRKARAAAAIAAPLDTSERSPGAAEAAESVSG